MNLKRNRQYEKCPKKLEEIEKWINENNQTLMIIKDKDFVIDKLYNVIKFKNENNSNHDRIINHLSKSFNIYECFYIQISKERNIWILGLKEMM